MTQDTERERGAEREVHNAKHDRKEEEPSYITHLHSVGKITRKHDTGEGVTKHISTKIKWRRREHSSKKFLIIESCLESRVLPIAAK